MKKRGRIKISEGEILLPHPGHPAVKDAEGSPGFGLLLRRAGDGLLHQPVFLRAGFVVQGEVVFQQEAAAAHQAHFAHQTEFRADGVHRHGTEIPDGVDEGLTVVFMARTFGHGKGNRREKQQKFYRFSMMIVNVFHQVQHQRGFFRGISFHGDG